MSEVTIITATTGSNYLHDNIKSVQLQTHKDVQHLIVVDGEEHFEKVAAILAEHDFPNIDMVVLPYATGKEQYNGHRIYGGFTHIAKGDYIGYLDEDNWLEPEHVEVLLDTVKDNQWAATLRKIVDNEGNFICNDDCESLCNWESVIKDYFVDVNCFFFTKPLALQLSPIWYRRARHPDDLPEVDRALTYTLKDNKIACEVTGKYTVNYRAGNRADSVQAKFFLQGNEIMKQKYNGDLPWRK
jgi:hypothetical protein